MIVPETRTSSSQGMSSSPSSTALATPIANNERPEHNATERWLDLSSTDGSLTTDGKKTPSHSDYHDSTIEPIKSFILARMSDPHPGHIFLIIDKSRNRALSVSEGKLSLENVKIRNLQTSVPKHLQWFCTELAGFKGFQNVAEGGFLGRDIWWDFYAKVPHHKGWESFTVSKRDGGHYWIQILDWWTQWQLSARLDGSGIFAERDGGTLWEFVKIQVPECD